jgi:hypothetical protein
MWDTFARSIRSVDVEGDRPWVMYLWPVDLPQLLHISVLQNIELSLNTTNINSYYPLHRICVAMMCSLLNIEIMESTPVCFFCNTELKL